MQINNGRLDIPGDQTGYGRPKAGIAIGGFFQRLFGKTVSYTPPGAEKPIDLNIKSAAKYIQDNARIVTEKLGYVFGSKIKDISKDSEGIKKALDAIFFAKNLKIKGSEEYSVEGLPEGVKVVLRSLDAKAMREAGMPEASPYKPAPSPRVQFGLGRSEILETKIGEEYVRFDRKQVTAEFTKALGFELSGREGQSYPLSPGERARDLLERAVVLGQEKGIGALNILREVVKAYRKEEDTPDVKLKRLQNAIVGALVRAGALSIDEAETEGVTFAETFRRGHEEHVTLTPTMKAQLELDQLLGPQANEKRVLLSKTNYSFYTLPQLLNLKRMRNWSEKEPLPVETIAAGVSDSAKVDILRAKVRIAGQPEIENPPEESSQVAEERQTKKLIALGLALRGAPGKRYLLTNTQLGILLELFPQVLNVANGPEYNDLFQNLNIKSPTSKYRVGLSRGREVEFSFQPGRAIVTIKSRIRIQTPLESRMEKNILVKAGGETLKEAETIQTIILDLNVPLSARNLIGPYRDVPLL